MELVISQNVSWEGKENLNFLPLVSLENSVTNKRKKVSNKWEESGHSPIVNILGHSTQVITTNSNSEI